MSSVVSDEFQIDGFSLYPTLSAAMEEMRNGTHYKMSFTLSDGRRITMQQQPDGRYHVHHLVDLKMGFDPERAGGNVNALLHHGNLDTTHDMLHRLVHGEVCGV
jgi:hypothetical protein